MRTPDFEQIGTMVYGVQRLDFVLSTLTQWLSGGAADASAGSTGQKFEERLAAAESYFSKQQGQDNLRTEYLHVLKTIHELEHACTHFLDGDKTAGLDEVLTKTRWAHSALADVIEKIGYPGVPAKFLRDRIQAS